jgi:hypothetical protein
MTRHSTASACGTEQPCHERCVHFGKKTLHHAQCAHRQNIANAKEGRVEGPQQGLEWARNVSAGRTGRSFVNASHLADLSDLFYFIR